jgi:sensor c-di-GMP phosphodiesterase-like protein
MKRTIKQRAVVAFAATVIGAVSGMVVGNLMGSYAIHGLAKRRLMEYAERILKVDVTYSIEARSLLAKANSSPYPFCSEAELAWFRKLVFASEYVQDVGHMRDGRLLCSATLGRDGIPNEQFKPSFTRWDGSRIYYNLVPLRQDTIHPTAVQLGDSFIVYNPYNEMLFASDEMHHTIKLYDVPNRITGPLGTSSTNVDPSVPAKDGEYMVHGSFYAVRCTTRFFNCVTTFNTHDEVFQAYRTQLIVSIIFGGLLGGCFGLLASFLYRRNRSMDNQLRRAIRREQLSLAYQPIVNLASKRIVGAEALARWTDEEGFVISPEIFIKIAEQRGFAGEITRLVTRRALSEFAEALRARPGFQISINVVASDLSNPRFLPMLEAELKRAEVKAESLIIEITESSTARNAVAIETILRLRRRGHSIHIDDFGTGYSSLSYLHDLSVNAIKIDRAFTQAIGTEAVTLAILPQILAMAEALRLQVVVEGIETQQQADYFAGGSYAVLGQGWLYGRPVPAEEFHRLLSEDETLSQDATNAA